jgi:small conductance mechanosensitive channel
MGVSGLGLPVKAPRLLLLWILLMLGLTRTKSSGKRVSHKAIKDGDVALKSLITVFFALSILGVSPVYSQAQNIGDEKVGEFQALALTLDTDIADLRSLLSEIDSAEKVDREVLFYRLDARVFRILADFDTLANQVAGLPEGSAQREAVTQQLAEFGPVSEGALLDRIENIKQHINDYNTQLNELGGATKIAMQAYIQTLESIRVKYYESLANHLQSRDVLGLPTKKMREQMDPIVYLYAETLAGRIEFTGVASNKLQERLSQDPDNADIGSALNELDANHKINIQRLEAIIHVLDLLGQDSSSFQAVMLQQASTISISFFSSSAILTVLHDGWGALKEAVKENAPNLIFRFLIFIVVLLVFKTLSRITKRVVRAASNKSNLDMSELLKNILVSTSGGIVMALGVLMALSSIGISLAPMLAGLGVAGFIVGFALQDSLGNFASGAMILLYRPFDVDDLVEVTGASGLVKKMNLVSTTIVTLDNQTLVVPNSKIWGDVIKNVTAQKVRRVDMVFGIAYDDDIELAERVLHEIVSAHDKILENPEPTIKLHTLGDSSVNFIVRPWTETEDYWDVYWDLTREVKLRFDREGISIPFPQRDVHVYTDTDI